MYEWWYEGVIEPWMYGSWMWRAVLASSMVGVMCGVLGCWLYLRRLSMMGDVLSHVVVLGLAVAFWLTGQRDGLTMVLGAVISGVIAGGAINQLGRWTRLKEDAAMGVVLSSFFALGVVIITSVARRVHLDADCVLFGNLLGVDDGSLVMLGVVLGMVLLLSGVFYRVLAVSSFDAGYAVSLGWWVGLVQHGLMGVMSLAAVASFEAVGSVLVVAMLVAPAATAHVLCRRLGAMFGVSVVHGLLCAVFGIYLSIWLNINPAGAMVLVGVGLYVLAVGWVRVREARQSVEGLEVM